MRSTIFEWNGIQIEATPTGVRRPLFRSPTGTLGRMSCHITTLDPGEKAHEPHRHREEEMIIVKEGTLDALLGDAAQIMGAGSVFFIAPNDLHGVRNVGSGQATYYVIKWWTTQMLEQPGA
jgi:mannose-6-phosphate isomerase-like protein (cupin superfamily)